MMASSIDDDASRSIEEVFGSRQSNALVSANVADEFDPLKLESDGPSTAA